MNSEGSTARLLLPILAWAHLELGETERALELAEHLVATGEDCAVHLTEPYRSIDHGDLLYDGRGLPR